MLNRTNLSGVPMSERAYGVGGYLVPYDGIPNSGEYYSAMGRLGFCGGVLVMHVVVNIILYTRLADGHVTPARNNHNSFKSKYEGLKNVIPSFHFHRDYKTTRKH